MRECSSLVSVWCVSGFGQTVQFLTLKETGPPCIPCGLLSVDEVKKRWWNIFDSPFSDQLLETVTIINTSLTAASRQARGCQSTVSLVDHDPWNNTSDMVVRYFLTDLDDITLSSPGCWELMHCHCFSMLFHIIEILLHNFREFSTYIPVPLSGHTRAALGSTTEERSCF